MCILETVRSTLSFDGYSVLVDDRLQYFSNLLEVYGLPVFLLHWTEAGEKATQIIAPIEAWEYLEAIGELN